MPWAGEEVEVYYSWLGDHQMQTALVPWNPLSLFRTLNPFLLPLFVLERAENLPGLPAGPEAEVTCLALRMEELGWKSTASPQLASLQTQRGSWELPMDTEMPLSIKTQGCFGTVGF